MLSPGQVPYLGEAEPARQADTSRAPALIDDVVAYFGGLDILVNNAAISASGTVDDPDADTAALDRMHATNYLGVIAVIRAASRVLRDGGRVITVSSGFGTGAGVPGVADYAATKAGVERYTMGVARDLGSRAITANVVEAGLMEGGMETPDPETLKALLSSLSLQRMGHPDEIAAAIAFLASPAASYVTGAVLDAHGGHRPPAVSRRACPQAVAWAANCGGDVSGRPADGVRSSE